MIKNGKQIYRLPSVNGIRDFVAQEFKKLPTNLKDIWHERAYPVGVSAKLQGLMGKVRAQHLFQYRP